MRYTYQEAYDKIIEAYHKDKIKPYDPSFCFCGTLHGDKNWCDYSLENDWTYTFSEYGRMEKVLIETLGGKWCFNGNCDLTEAVFSHNSNYEEKLFKGMCAALDVLKQIHIERGEDVEIRTTITKRKLEKV